jgi:predicted transcriptional regulator
MDKRILELETRKELYELIKSNPGLHLREISRQSGLLSSLVEYHLRYLLKNDLIFSVKEKGYTRFYVSKKSDEDVNESSFNNRQKQILHFLRQEIPLKVILLLLDKNTALHKEILREVGTSGSTLSYHLKKLVSSNIIIHTRAGVQKGYRIQNREEILKVIMIIKIKPATLADGFLSTWEDFL